MPGAQAHAHASRVTGDQHPDDTPRAMLSAFVVELRAPGSPSSDIHGMHKALMYAVSRLRVAGVAITAGRSVLLPRDARCLCLLLAAGEESVVLARDTAGLSTAAIHQAVPLPDTGGEDDWWNSAKPDTPALGGTS